MTISVTPQIVGTLTGSNTLAAVSIAASLAGMSGTDLGQGTGSMNADKAYAATRTTVASTAINIDLAASTTEDDIFGLDLTMAKLKCLYIKNKAAAGSGASLVVGNGTNPALLGFAAAAHTWTIPPQGILLVTAPDLGWTVTGATADILKLTPSAHVFDIDIVILGASA